MNRLYPDGQSVPIRRPVVPLLELSRALRRYGRVAVWAPALLLVIAALGLMAARPDWNWLAGLGIRLPAGTVLAVFLIALCCEYIDSSLGMGYGTALTPILMMLGFEPLQIVPAVLFSECLTGFSAGLLHHRDGNVDFLRDRRARGTAMLLAALSGLGALVAVSVTLSVSKFWITAGIGGIITVMGVLILATIRRQLRYRAGHLVTVGAIAAFNKGFSGGGYGPLVTAGQVVSGVSSKQAVGITSIAEAVTCLVGVTAYLVLHKGLCWSLALPMTLGALFSVPVATLTVRRLPEKLMRGAVGVGTLALGLLTLFRLLAS